MIFWFTPALIVQLLFPVLSLTNEAWMYPTDYLRVMAVH